MERRPFTPARVLRALLGTNPPVMPDPMEMAIRATLPVTSTNRAQRRRHQQHASISVSRFSERMDVPGSRR